MRLIVVVVVVDVVVDEVVVVLDTSEFIIERGSGGGGSLGILSFVTHVFKPKGRNMTNTRSRLVKLLNFDNFFSLIIVYSSELLKIKLE